MKYLASTGALVLTSTVAWAQPAPQQPRAIPSGQEIFATSEIKAPQLSRVAVNPPATTIVHVIRSMPNGRLQVANRFPVATSPAATSPAADTQPGAALPVTVAKPVGVPVKSPDVTSGSSAAALSVLPSASSKVHNPQLNHSRIARQNAPTRANLAPAVAPKAAETKVAALPKADASKVVAPKPAVPAPARAPSQLNSRHKDRLLLAQLEAELKQAERRLNQADVKLTKSQQQLAKFSNTLQEAMLEAGPDAKGLHPFVRVAQRYAGTPYKWGGESTSGFDCSGFIIVVMRDLGYKTLPHSAAEQFNYGKPIAQALLKPGDLVFFANTYKPGVSHVGIYLGKRRFIHAAGTGKGTIVSSLNNPAYQSKYAGARRLVAARGGR